MSLISSKGPFLSGGCLGSGYTPNARKVMASGTPVCIRYDGDDEDDLSYRLGIGCGGIVHVLLEPVNAENNYQGLLDIQHALLNRQSGYFKQHIPAPGAVSLPSQYIVESALTRKRKKADWMPSTVKLADFAYHTCPHLLIAGGGIDAQPVVALANQPAGKRPFGIRDPPMREMSFSLWPTIDCGGWSRSCRNGYEMPRSMPPC